MVGRYDSDQLQHTGTTKNTTVDMILRINRSFEIYGYMVIVKSTTTVNQDRMQFGTFLFLAGHCVDTGPLPNQLSRDILSEAKASTGYLARSPKSLVLSRWKYKLVHGWTILNNLRFSVKEVY